jgi:hypothetical protein
MKLSNLNLFLMSANRIPSPLKGKLLGEAGASTQDALHYCLLLAAVAL